MMTTRATTIPAFEGFRLDPTAFTMIGESRDYLALFADLEAE